jgi:hypothetical protein
MNDTVAVIPMHDQDQTDVKPLTERTCSESDIAELQLLQLGLVGGGNANVLFT